jgi:hypothetical protein
MAVVARSLRRARTLAMTGVAVATCLATLRCGGNNTPTQPSLPPTNQQPPGPNPNPIPIPSAPQIFVGAGDIGWCGSAGMEQTVRLLEGLGATVFTAGDNAYFFGTAKEFNDCYEPSWGRVKSHTRPVPGNHEYEGAGPGPYFDYFGTNAGPRGLGYYSFEMGDWHAIALNSWFPGTPDGPGQEAWLRSDLFIHQNKCTIAYWHYPLFTSGKNGNQTQMRPIWRILYEAGVDIVVNGHDHSYERFAPQTPDGVFDNARGIREFVAGTGGAMPYAFVSNQPNSEVKLTNVFGVLKFTLSSGSYDWQFITASGGGSDSGRGDCH